MREIFEKLIEADETEQNEFSYDTELELYVDGLEDGEESTGPKEVNLTYAIYTEWRSWGLKDISVVPKGRVEFEVEIVDVDDNVVDTIPVSIDSDDVTIMMVSGASYAPESFVVRVDRTGKLIDADLNFYFQDHNK
jgi:hypothetical protein